jgi:hypothetical protein
MKGGDKIPATIEYLKSGMELLDTQLEALKISEILDLDTIKKILIVNATYLTKNVCLKIQ